MDENGGSVVHDSSGGGNDGIIHGAEWASGRSSSGLGFDGANDYVNFSPFDASSMTSGTLETWIKTSNANSGNKRIVEVGTSSDRAGLFMNNAYVYLYAKDGGREVISLRSSNTVNDGVWHHVAGTWGSSGGRIYVDGVEKGNVSGDKRLSLPTSGTGYIGEYVVGGNYYFNGLIDEVVIYNRALTTQEVADRYDSFFGPTPTPTSTSTPTSTPTPTATPTGGSTTVVWVDPPEQTAYLSGGTFTVNVAITDAVNLGRFQFSLAFSPAIVHVEGVELGDLLGSTARNANPLGPQIDNQVGTVLFGGFSFGEPPGPDGSGVVATISFSPQAEGESDLQLQGVRVTDTAAEVIG